jgi:hypothetical protein
MRLLHSICAALLLMACNGGGQPPDAPATSGEVKTVEPKPSEPKDEIPPVVGKDPNTGGTTQPQDSGGTTGSATSPSCGGRTCAAGETCISYYGIAGPRGPQFHECGIRCRRGERDDGCPSGKRCVTIADGPGDVCR